LKAPFVSLQRLTLQAPMNRFCKLNLRISLAKADESTRAINKVRRKVVSQQVTNLKSERKAHFGESPKVRAGLAVHREFSAETAPNAFGATPSRLCLNFGVFFEKLTQASPTLSPFLAAGLCRLIPVGSVLSSFPALLL